MKKKPVVGISAGLIYETEGTFAGYRRSYVSEDYVNGVLRAGGIPVILPILEDEESVIAQIDVVDALLLSGGQDPSPLLYGEEPHPKLQNTLPIRDAFDTWLIRHALEKKIPILGICRGHQMLNVVCGGSLYQDMSMYQEYSVQHVQDAFPYTLTHKIAVEEGSKLHKILGAEAVVNSYHHQAVKQPAPGFVVTARAKDGTVEAMEKEGSLFVMGVQFHPEMMVVKHDFALKIFEALVEAGKKRKKNTMA